jgi:hypothetical protein
MARISPGSVVARFRHHAAGFNDADEAIVVLGERAFVAAQDIRHGQRAEVIPQVALADFGVGENLIAVPTVRVL